MTIDTDTHSFVLFAHAAKHCMEDALRMKRLASCQADKWLAEQSRDRAERLRLAAWRHLESARDLKRLVTA